jgi:hypothetical protein
VVIRLDEEPVLKTGAALKPFGVRVPGPPLNLGRWQSGLMRSLGKRVKGVNSFGGSNPLLPVLVYSILLIAESNTERGAGVWLNGAVSKTDDPKGCAGSNPVPAAFTVRLAPTLRTCVRVYLIALS